MTMLIRLEFTPARVAEAPLPSWRKQASPLKGPDLERLVRGSMLNDELMDFGAL